MPAFFAAMLVPPVGGARRAWGWIVGGIVAVAVERLVPGWWFIVAGSIAERVSQAASSTSRTNELRAGHIRGMDGHPRNGRGDLRDPRGRLLADGICSADAARPQHSQCASGVGVVAVTLPLAVRGGTAATLAS